MALRLVRVGADKVGALRAERQSTVGTSFEPGFYLRLVKDAQPFVVLGEDEDGLGHVLLVEHSHGGHSHRTVVELYLKPGLARWYEDLLDLLRDKLSPTAYLTVTDDCSLNVALLARGLQVEPVALVMTPEEGAEPGDQRVAGLPAGLELTTFLVAHLAQANELVHQVRDRETAAISPAPKSGRAAEEVFSQLKELAESGRSWLLVKHGKPVAVLARSDTPDDGRTLLDYAVGTAAEAELAAALREVTVHLQSEGRHPLAVIDASEPGRRRIFRGAGYHTTSAYVVYYDPGAGRPSVGVIGLAELQAMTGRGEQFRLVDVLGEEHWKQGHLPGAEWIDFRALAREARKRFQPEETIVVYCNGFRCEAGGIAADKLRQLGFSKVLDFAGGLEEWVAAGLPLEKG